MKYIFGLGMPRTGTNSLGSALHMMNINGECKCILNDFHNKREKDNNNKDYKYIIYNDSYNELDMLLDKDKIYDNKYILTIRDNLDWKKSIKKFNKDIVKDLLEITMDNYIELIKEMFVEKGCIDNLLIINMFEDSEGTNSSKLWEKLYKFLDLPLDMDIIDDEFPKIDLNK